MNTDLLVAPCGRDPRAPKGVGAMTSTGESILELAERTSNGTLTRLFWLQGTRQLWVEVYDRELDETIVIPAEPDRALEAFYHPYAFATADPGRPTGAGRRTGRSVRE